MADTIMHNYKHQWDSPVGPVTQTWIGETSARPGRVYALAFISPQKMLLVSGDDPRYPGPYLPGGGVEAGETAEEALARELREEANARIVALEVLGSQYVAFHRGGGEYQSYYWCRIVLEEPFIPSMEITKRHIVPGTTFLDTLEWGRKDPLAAHLLELALEVKWR